MGKRFVENAYRGNNSASAYWLLIGGIVIYWLFLAHLTVIGTNLILISLSCPTLVAKMVSEASPFAIVVGWIILGIQSLHHRPWRSLVNAESSINYKRIAQGFAVWAGLVAIWLPFDLIANPQDYQWEFEPGRWLLLFVLSILLVPIQTTAEELLYRGYLLQGLRLKTKNTLILIGVVSLAFAIPHFANPEMARGAFVWGALSYFAWGVIFTAITLKDNGLELALGVHAANNLFSYLIVTTPDSAVSSPALWTYTPYIDPRLTLLTLLVDGAFFYATFFGGIPRRKPVEECSEPIFSEDKNNEFIQ